MSSSWVPAGRRKTLVIGAAASLLLAACSEGGSETATPPTADPPITAAATSPVVEPNDEIEPIVSTVPADEPDVTTVDGEQPSPPTDDPVAEALEKARAYVVGGTGQAGGAPLKIGYINQEGSTPGFPEATFGLDAAVQFVNEQLGGADGRPIEIERCFANTGEDGTKCAQQFLADDAISLVMTGTIADDAITQPIFNTLRGLKPVIIGNPLTTAEFVATDGYALTPGSPGVLTGIAIFVATDLVDTIGEVDSVAVLTADTPAGRLAVDVLLKPTFERLGITDIRTVPVSNTSGPQEYASAIQAADAQDADVLVPIVTVQGCIGAAQALVDLDIDITVVASALCLGTPMREYLRLQGSELDAPDGWYFANYGDSLFVDADTELNAFVTLALEYAADADIDNPEFTGFAPSTFGNILTLAKLVNEIGGENVTPDSIRTWLVDFRGPQWGIAGPIECAVDTLLPALCGTHTGIERYQDGVWSNVRSASGGNAIDTSVELPD